MIADMLKTKLSRFRSVFSADDGMALATVVAISAILFLLSTTLVMLASQEQVSATQQVRRTKALNAADAAVNDYLYRLSHDFSFRQTEASATPDATWTISATQDPKGGAIFLTAAGTVPAAGGRPAITRTVKATVQQPTFADYTFLFNTSVSVGSGALIKGNVRSNVSISNAGEITGNAFAGTTYSGSGKCDGTIYQNYGTLSFATVDFAKLRSIAASDSCDFSGLATYESYVQSGTTYYRNYLGYNVVLNGTSGTITPIQGINTTTGTMTVDATKVTNFTIPTHGVVYFNEPIWLSGTYGGKLTIVDYADVEDTSNNGIPEVTGFNTAATSVAGMGANHATSTVYLWNNLVPDDASTDHVLGVVSQGDISATSEYASTPANVTFQGAMLSTSGSMHADMTSGRSKAHMQITGACAAWQPCYFVSGSTGFLTRDYWYDPRLNNTPPPNFPPLGDGSLKVMSWVEY